MSKKEYSADSIDVLTDVEHIRRRPSMYIGSDDEHGLYHIFKEVLDNSLDEHLAGHASAVSVTLDDDKLGVTIADNGRGIPHDTHKKTGLSTLTTVFAVARSGGKFDGKTYATCFTGDTRIKLLDGRKRSLKWLTKHYKDKTFWVYSCDKNGAFHAGKAHSPRITGRVTELVEVTLDNGRVERCTPEHRWLLRNGSYCRAENLKVGSSLMPCYTHKDENGYTQMQPNFLTDEQSILRRGRGPYQRSRKDRAGIPVHRLIGADLFGADVFGNDVHHKNRNRTDNRPKNLELLTKKEHIQEHRNDAGAIEHRNKQTSPGGALYEWATSDKGRRVASNNGKRHGRNNLLTYVYSEANSEDKRARMSAMNANGDTADNTYWKIVKHVAKCLVDGIALSESNFDKHRPYQNFPRIETSLRWFNNSWDELIDVAEGHKAHYNHRVVAVRRIRLSKPTKVYDITVDKWHNFALASGVYVHNSVGLHGVGSTATNALSELFEAWSYRNKKVAYVKFNFGLLPKGMKDAVVKPDKKQKSSGTTVHFRPDYANIFKDVGVFNVREIKARLEEVSYLAPGLRLEFFDSTKASKPKGEFYSKDGLRGLVTSRLGKKKLGVEQFHTSVEIPVQVEGGKTSKAVVDIALSWLEDLDDAPLWMTYVNLTPTPEGGSHQLGVEKALSTVLLGMAKNKCSTVELFRGLRCAVHIRHPDPKFKSQTKEKLINKDVSETLTEVTTPLLKKWTSKHREWVDAFIQSCIEAYEQRTLDKTARAALRELSVKKGAKGLVPGKLYEADCDPSVRELFLVEGDSAGGHLVDARDAGHQEVLFLRGKVINSLRADLGKVLANAEYANVVKAIGANVGPTFDLKKCRVNKVILLCFHGQTVVPLANGSKTTMAELAARGPGHTFDVKTKTPGGTTFTALGYNARQTGVTESWCVVTLADGNEIKCTPDHLWAVRNASDLDPRAEIVRGRLCVKAKDLTPEDDIDTVD